MKEKWWSSKLLLHILVKGDLHVSKTESRVGVWRYSIVGSAGGYAACGCTIILISNSNAGRGSADYKEKSRNERGRIDKRKLN